MRETNTTIQLLPELKAEDGIKTTNKRLLYCSYAIVLFALLVYLGNTYRSSLERWDDAYITFRYAQHVAQGQGLIWNVGGDRVEGFTSLLHVLLIALGTKLGINPELSSVLISLGAVVATFAMMSRVLQHYFGYFHPAAAVILGLYLLDNNTAVHTTSGLETQLFVALLCGSYLTALRFLESPQWATSILLAVLIFLSVLCRPEGVLYGVGQIGVILFCGLKKTDPYTRKRFSFLKLAVTGCLILFLGVVYSTWKFKYFGYILPNPYYVKSGHLSLAGWKYVLYYVAHLGAWFGPILIGFFLFIANRGKTIISIQEKIKAGRKTLVNIIGEGKHRSKLLLTLASPALALTYYLTIIHEVGGAHRFSYPTYFYLVMAGAILVTLYLRDLQVEAKQWYKFGSITAVWLLVLLIYQGSWRIIPTSPSDFFQYHFKIASALKETGIETDGTILCDAAGVIPFFSRFNQIDRVGLTDNFLSGRKAISLEEREAYLWSRNTDVYVGYEPPATIGVERVEDEPRMEMPYVSQILLKRKLTLIEDRIFVQEPSLLYARMKELRNNWHLVGEISWPGWRLWRLKSFVYVRKSSPHADLLVTSLSKIIAVDGSQIDLLDLK